MKNTLNIIVLVFAVLTVASVVLQQKGSGLSGVFGGSDVSYMSKRGAEKFLVFFTVFSAVVMCIAATLILFV